MTGTRDIEAIDEVLIFDRIDPAEYDALLARGFKRLNTIFERYDSQMFGGQRYAIIPLRIRLAEFKLSSSQRRTLRKNTDVEVTIGPAEIDSDMLEVFEAHRTRFTHDEPESITDYLSGCDRGEPVDCRELRVTKDGRLLAASFFDVGVESVAAFYGMFDPEHAKRRLGIFTILKEIQFAALHGKEFYYLGYIFDGPTPLNYKKHFAGLEAFDWRGYWQPCEAG